MVHVHFWTILNRATGGQLLKGKYKNSEEKKLRETAIAIISYRYAIPKAFSYSKNNCYRSLSLTILRIWYMQFVHLFSGAHYGESEFHLQSVREGLHLPLVWPWSRTLHSVQCHSAKSSLTECSGAVGGDRSI